jgi:hypothetical protein
MIKCVPDAYLVWCIAHHSKTILVPFGGFPQSWLTNNRSVDSLQKSLDTNLLDTLFVIYHLRFAETTLGPLTTQLKLGIL